MWANIEAHQGHGFKTKEGKNFTYICEHGCVKPTHTTRNLSRGQFERVFAMGRLSKPSDISKRDQRIQGTSYVWAILNDERIVG